MKVVCIIQARMGSTRLPAKVMKPLLDKPILWWDMHRVQKAHYIDEIVIATTTEVADDAIADYCDENGWSYYRGSEDDVLDRYYQAATMYQADVIVRITSDCPMIDARVIDYALSAHLGQMPAVDYTSNFVTRHYPRGLDCEVFTYEALSRAWQEASQQSEREHVTPYIWQNPDKFRLSDVSNSTDYSHLRWTVDTPEDYEFVTTIYEHFGHGDFSWQDVIAVLDDHPEWVEINRHIEQKKL